jgi:hypothetical protein
MLELVKEAHAAEDGAPKLFKQMIKFSFFNMVGGMIGVWFNPRSPFARRLVAQNSTTWLSSYRYIRPQADSWAESSNPMLLEALLSAPGTTSSRPSPTPTTPALLKGTTDLITPYSD